MHIVILVAGVADPKRPLERPASGDWSELLSRPTTPFKMSPFDEAALEIALKLRDADPALKLTAVVTHGCGDLPFMRAVAAYRPDRVVGLCPPAEMAGDPAWLAEHALQAAHDEEAPIDLILMGREHGDLDDGVTPAFLAAKWKWPFLGLAQSVRAAGASTWHAERTGAMANEIFTVTGPAVISVTNAKSNRLRHPLMKNVMLAKQLKFEIVAPGGSTDRIRLKTTAATPPATVARGTVPCTMLQGNVQEQARQLAQFLVSSAAGKAHA